jgi:hypothetical protein
MAAVRDELLAREITREELKALVDEWVAAGGKIKQCKPADAYSFHTSPIGPSLQNKDGLVQMRKSLRSWIDTGKKTVKSAKAKGKKKK